MGEDLPAGAGERVGAHGDSPPGPSIEIEKLIPDGKSLGRLADGRVVILPVAVPGDRVVPREVRESRGLWRAGTFTLVEPAPQRIDPPCPVAGACGGCDWMTMSTADQRRHKLSVLDEALRRIGKLASGSSGVSLTGADTEGYRCRVRLKVEGVRVGFASRGSHQLVEPARCLVMAPELQSAVAELRDHARSLPRGLQHVLHVELRVGSDGGVGLYVQLAEGAPAEAMQQFEPLRRRFVVASSSDPADAGACQRFDLTDQAYLLAPLGGFTQVHWQVNRQLIGRLLEGVRERGVHTFLDLFAGSGNFSLPLLAVGCQGVAVESHGPSVAAARRAATEQTLPAESFVRADAMKETKRLARAGRRFDLVIVDPPRAGVAGDLTALVRSSSGWLVVCSCNPVTLARDLRRLRELGCSIESIEAFDMFPHTHHLETLVWLRVPSAAVPPPEGN